MYGFLASLLLFKSNRILFFLTFVTLCLFLNLAYTNGIDWTAYQLLYENESFHTRGIEFGYTGLVLIGKFLGLNFEFFKFIILSFNLYVILKFIFRVSEKPAFVVIILFQTHLLGNFFEPAIRQLQAVVIFIFAFDYLVNNKRVKYIATVLFGALFHQSMLVLAFIPFIVKYLNYKTAGLIILIGAFVSPEINKVITVLSVFPMFRDYLFYVDSNFFEGLDLSLFNIAKALVYLVPLYLLKNYKNDDPTVITIRSLSYLFFICFAMQFFVMLFYRFNHYFIIFYVVYISYIFDIYRRRLERYTFLSFYVIIHFISLIKGVEYYRDRDSMKYFPYTNYFIEYILDRTYDNPQDKIDARLMSRWNDSSE